MPLLYLSRARSIVLLGVSVNTVYMRTFYNLLPQFLA